MNLGWKLAAVLKNQAPAALLDTFERERRPIGQRLHDNTLAQSALASAFDPAGLALRAEISRFLQVPELNRMVAGAISGFSIAYPDPLLAESDHSGIETGQRVPDEDLTLPDGQTTAIFDHLADGRWLHLSLRDGAQVQRPSWLPQDVVTVLAARRRKEGGELQGRAAVLIRPDGYIARSIPVGT